MIIRDRKCARCGKVFTPDGLTQKYDRLCGAIVRDEQRRASYERKKEREWLERERIREQARYRDFEGADGRQD